MSAVSLSRETFARESWISRGEESGRRQDERPDADRLNPFFPLGWGRLLPLSGQNGENGYNGDGP